MTTHKEHFAHTLRDFVGHHAPTGVKELSKLSGVSERNFYNAMQGNVTYEIAQAIKFALGADFSARLDAPIGIQGHCRPNVFTNERRILSSLSRTTAIMAEFYEDGKICHREKATLRKTVFPRTAEMINGYLRLDA